MMTSGMATIRDSVRRLGRLNNIGAYLRPTLATAPEVVMNFLGDGAGDARHRLDIFERRHHDGAGTAEMMQERSFAAGADARHFIQHGARDIGAAPCAVGADGEAM